MVNLEAAPRSPYYNNPPSDDLLHETQDVRVVEVAKDVRVGYTLLNRRLIGEASAIVAVGAFMSDLTSPDRAYEGIQLATLERPILMLDLPGHGLSSPHSVRQVLDLCLRRSADSGAAPLVEATSTLLGSEDEIDYFGISHGSLISLKSAELDPVDRVKTVFGIDLPAVKKRLTLGLQAGYMITDGLIGRREYLKALEGTVFSEDYEDFKELFAPNAPERAGSFLRNDKKLFFLNLFSSINARPVALDSWSKIMNETSASISVITSENGSISDPEAIAAFILNLPDHFQERSHQTVIAGEDHNIGIVHLMPRVVAWAKAAYDARP
jgi:pimeloyl-ACP methyl ester carboxylesterase